MLAKKGDPYITSDGQALISKSAFGERPNFQIGVPRAKNLSPNTIRSVKELPTDPKTQTAIMVVLGFALLGMSNNEIAHMIGHSIADVEKIKEHDAYQETYEIMFHEFISTNSSSMQARIAAYAPKALENMMDIADNSEHDMSRVHANRDILDRSGLHHETLYGKNAIQDSGFETLKIVIEDGDEKRTDINIDLKRKS